MRKWRGDRERGNCQGGTEGAQSFLRGIDSFPLVLVTRDYQGLLCSSYLKEVWVGKLSRGWSRKEEFIRLCSRVSGNSLGYENQALDSWEGRMGLRGASDTNNGVDPSLAPALQTKSPRVQSLILSLQMQTVNFFLAFLIPIPHTSPILPLPLSSPGGRELLLRLPAPFQVLDCREACR